MPRIVVAAPPAVTSVGDLSLATLPAAADVVELRLDLLGLPADVSELRRWIDASPRPVMATLRSRGQGGEFSGSPADAAAHVACAAAAGAAYVDVELPVAEHVGALPPSVAVVVSHHGPGPVDFPAEVGGRPVRYWKHARSVDSASDVARLRDRARGADARLTLVPFGPLGAWRGAFATPPGGLLYGAAAGGAAVIAGQPALVELLDELRAGEVTPDADLYGLLGRPPARSPSPALHNAAFRAHGRDALYLPLPGVGLRAALALPFLGYSVTTPYKQEALARADEADETARLVGAANTLLRRRAGGWSAANTDVVALREAVGDAEGASAFVYGAGGYARAAVVALAERGYEIRLGARSPDRGRAVADALGVPWGGTRFVRGERDLVLVNATPAGADAIEPSFVDAAALAGLVLLDAPYRRDGRPTGLIAAGARGGALRVVDGLRLLTAQAALQAELFSRRPVDPLVLETAARSPAPLLLMGLRGAGKSTVGRAVARRLGRPFTDLDDEVTRITGKRPAWWIRMRGEASFRSVEADAVERLQGRQGLVVAAGGGVLEHPRARRVVEESTWPLLLDASPEVAAARVAACFGDRPLLADASDPLAEARRLSTRRQSGWRRVARAVIDASRSLDEVVDDVVDAWTRGDGLARPPRAEQTPLGPP